MVNKESDAFPRLIIPSFTCHTIGEWRRLERQTMACSQAPYMEVGVAEAHLPNHPHYSLWHCLASFYAAFSQSSRKNTSYLQDFSVKDSLKVDMAGERVLSTYVLLSVRLCIYNSKSMIVLCPLCWVCYENEYVHELKRSLKKITSRWKPLNEKHTNICDLQ